MAMDFFEHQERARKRTGLLLFYFFLAVSLTVLAVNTAFYAITTWSLQPGITVDRWLAGPVWPWISLTTLGIISAGSLIRYVQLRDGGHVIADAVHARRVDPDTTDAQERMLLNIVEEMAIASGVPAPTTYVMDDEHGINAFVAGFQPTEAVLVVTKGALATFNRDEMQGVIGHEFSHILNGDMRMNVQLYAILAGILLIGRIGEFLLRSAGRGRSSRDNKGAGLVLVVGLALMVVGYVGLFFGRLIKAAISGQRELLADASSVQFTRNPQGLGEALLKIRNATDGSLLANSHAEDMSHMCFALPVHMQFSALLATHPPLDERINTIDPSLLARARARAHKDQLAAQQASSSPAAMQSPAIAGIAGAATAGNFTVSAPSSAAATMSASIGQPTPEHLALATRLYAGIPEPIRDMLRTAAGARAVIYGITLAATDARHEADGIRLVAAGDSQSLANRLSAAMPELRRLGTRQRLPCHDLALPALRPMSDDQKKSFLAVLEQLVRVDQRMTLREYLTLSLMRKHLSARATAVRPVRHRSYGSVIGPVNVVVSLLCHASGCRDDECTQLHARVMRGFAAGMPALLPVAGLTATQLLEALEELAALSPLLKKPLLDACIDCISHDGRLQVAEVELLRAVGEALDCPVPPLAGMA